MATILREVLTADAMRLPIFCGGQSFVGISLAGSWVGTAYFEASTDGVNFKTVYATPFASGTNVATATATGSWLFPCANYVAFQVRFSRTSGSLSVTLAAAIDSSWQDAYLASASKYVSQSVTGGSANAITITAQANRSWRVRTAVVGYDQVGSNVALFTISDGTVLWATYVPVGATGNIGNFVVPLPPDPGVPGVVGGGVVGALAAGLVVTLAAPGGSVVSKLSLKCALHDVPCLRSALPSGLT